MTLSILRRLLRVTSSRRLFVTRADYEAQRIGEVTASLEHLAELRASGLDVGQARRLDYTFYTNHLAKAEAIAQRLARRGYDATVSTTHNWSKNTVLVYGLTTPLQMDDETIVRWTEGMCDLGFAEDAAFAIWFLDD